MMVDWANVFWILFVLVLGIVIGATVGRTASEIAVEEKTKLLETAVRFLKLQNADLIKEIEAGNQERKSA